MNDDKYYFQEKTG